MSNLKVEKPDKTAYATVWDSILLRDSLDDDGTIPWPGSYPYTSPDIICTRQQQVDPNQFSQNYGVNPGKDPYVNQNNFFYVRGKNLGANPSDGTVYLFWCPSSLLMYPNQWSQNSMQANIGGQMQPYNLFPSTGNRQIAVTQSPFIWSPVPPPPSQHYCLVGAVSTPTHPWSVASIPVFNTWDDFVIWVRNNGNICWRNMNVVSNPYQPSWDRLDLIANGPADVTMLAMATCLNVPVGTSITLANDQLGITNTVTITDPNQTVYSQGALCPASYNGYVQTLAVLPQGQSWPTGATVTTTLLFAAPAGRPVARYAHDFGTDGKHPNVLETLKRAEVDNPVLVPVGNCSTRMIPAVTA